MGSEDKEKEESEVKIRRRYSEGNKSTKKENMDRKWGGKMT